MLRTLTFQLEESGWHVVLPDWHGVHGALRMVAGADTLLDYIADGAREVTLLISTEFLPSFDLQITGLNDSGDYVVTSDQWTRDSHLLSHKLWLCGVTVHALGYYPETMYLQVLNIDDVTTPVEHKTTVKGWFKWFWSYFKMKVL